MTSTRISAAAVAQPRPPAKPAADDAQFAGEQAERREPDERQHAEPEAPGQHRVRRGQAADLVDPAGPGELQDPAGGQEQHALGQAVAQDVQQHRRDRQRAADRRAEGEQPMCSMLE